MLPNSQMFPKMFPIAHHTLSQKFAQSWTTWIVEPKGNMFIIMFWKSCIGSGIIQTSKSQIVFEIIWAAFHNYIIELAYYNRQVVVPMNVGQMLV